MIEQITSSIDGDCDVTYLTRPSLQSGEDWLRDKTKEALHDIDRHTKGHNEELDRTNARNLWVKQLRDSLKCD